MSRKAIVTCVLFVMIAAAACAQPLITAYRTDVPPTIDGRLDDVCWDTANVTSPFISASEPGLPDAQTQARVCWDDANVYVAFEAFDPYLDPKRNMLYAVKAEASGPDARVFAGDDVVELFIQPPDSTYYHFASNSGDGTIEKTAEDKEWDGAWEVEAVRGNASYVVEMAIPFSSLSARPEGTWRVNFARERSAVVEWSTWCGLKGRFHQPEKFGVVQFAESGPAVGAVELRHEGQQAVLQAQVAGEDANLHLTVVAGDQQSSASKQGVGEAQIPAAIPKAATETAEYTVSYRLAGAGGVVLRSPEIPQRISAATVTMSVQTRDARAEVFVNGHQWDPADSETLQLCRGVNVIAVRAAAEGDDPAVLPSISTEGPVEVRWMVRPAEEGDQWLSEIPGDGWAPAAEKHDGLWTAGGASEAQFVAVVYAGDPAHQLFANRDVYHFPRDSRQLFRYYLHGPADAPLDDYRMVLEVPSELEYVTYEPISGGPMTVDNLGEVTREGVQMTRWAVSYEVGPPQGVEISMRLGDRYHRQRLSHLPIVGVGGTHDWTRVSTTITMPSGAENIAIVPIKWRNRGIEGTFWADNIVVRRKGADEPVFSTGFDEPDRESSSRIKPEGPDGSNCVKFVSVHKNADQADAVWLDTVEVEPNAQYVVEADIRCEDLIAHQQRSITGLLFSAPATMAEAEYPMYTYFQSLGGMLTEVPQKSTLVVHEPLADVRPEHARLMPFYSGSMILNPVVAVAYAQNCWKAGCTWMYGQATNNVMIHLRDRGVKLIRPFHYEEFGIPPNMHGFLEEHPEAQGYNFNGQPVEHLACPTWMLAEGDEVIAGVGRFMKAIHDNEKYEIGIWDHERPIYGHAGTCSCDRCMAAFREFANLPDDVELTPETVIEKHMEQWTEFRTMQNAELAGRLRDIAHTFDPPAGFAVYSGWQSERTMRHYGVDWAKMAPNIDMGVAGYGGNEKLISTTADTLGDTPLIGSERWYRRYNTDEAGWMKEEEFANRILRQYVTSGCDGVMWWYLASMDGGAFHFTSKAAALIAEYEDFLKKEQACDEKVTVTGLDSFDWAAFEKDGEILVLLLNFTDEAITPEVTVAEKTFTPEIEAYGYHVLMVDWALWHRGGRTDGAGIVQQH